MPWLPRRLYPRHPPLLWQHLSPSCLTQHALNRTAAPTCKHNSSSSSSSSRGQDYLGVGERQQQQLLLLLLPLHFAPAAGIRGALLSLQKHQQQEPQNHTPLLLLLLLLLQQQHQQQQGPSVVRPAAAVPLGVLTSGTAALSAGPRPQGTLLLC